MSEAVEISRSSPRVLIIHRNAAPYMDMVRKRFPQVHFEVTPTHAALAAQLAHHQPDIIYEVAESGEGVTTDDLRPIFAAPSVKWLHLARIGYELMPPFDGKKPIVTNAYARRPGNPEFALGLMLAANMHLPAYLRQQAERRWNIIPWSSVNKRTLLLVGLGRIGKEIARLAKPFGLHIIGIRSRLESVPHVDEVRTLDALHDSLREADFVSLQVPTTDETRHLMGAAAIDCMRREAWLMNLGRGALVDEDALIAALREQRIRGALLDVFQQEPLPPESPLWTLPNVILTPHSSGALADFAMLAVETFCDNLDRWLRQEPLAAVLPPHRPEELA